MLQPRTEPVPACIVIYHLYLRGYNYTAEAGLSRAYCPTYLASGLPYLLDRHDIRANEQALKHGARLLSAYQLRDDTKIWIITEADRSSTTVLLPEEY
jgi:hypothetical protein